MLALPVWAEAPLLSQGTVTLEGEVTQGALLHGKTEPGAKITFDGRTLQVLPDGRFIIGFGRDDDAEQTLIVQHLDGTKETISLAVQQRDYDVQRINNIPKDKVNAPEDAKAQARIKKQNSEIGAARKNFTLEPLWDSGFHWPVAGKISGVYGSQRVLNGVPKRPHFGVDIAAPEGSKMLAPADGIVRLAQADNYFSGNTLVIDHGYGLTSTYLHLQKMLVKPGQKVKQGEQIGAVGTTGRSTGPHLCWRMHWFEVPLDPMKIVAELPLGGETQTH